jgi:hypothetical protein
MTHDLRLAGDFTRDIPLEDDPRWSGAPAGC